MLFKASMLVAIVKAVVKPPRIYITLTRVGTCRGRSRDMKRGKRAAKSNNRITEADINIVSWVEDIDQLTSSVLWNWGKKNIMQEKNLSNYLSRKISQPIGFGGFLSVRNCLSQPCWLEGSTGWPQLSGLLWISFIDFCPSLLLS